VRVEVIEGKDEGLDPFWIERIVFHFRSHFRLLLIALDPQRAERIAQSSRRRIRRRREGEEKGKEKEKEVLI